MVRSEVWEVIANLKWVAFGMPMFSRRLDAGYNALQDRLTLALL